MVSLTEFIISAIYIGTEVTGVWQAINPIIPKEIINIILSILSVVPSWTFFAIGLIYFLLIVWRINLEKTFLKLDYRFKNSADSLNIPTANLETPTGEITYIFLNGKIENRFYRELLSLLHCKLLLIFESPIDVLISCERQYRSVENIDEKPNSLTLACDIRTSGARKIELAFAMDDLGDFAGKDQISMKICVGPKMQPFRKIFQHINGTLCENKIDIV